MNIGNKIKFFREKQGISMDELATALDVSKSTVSRYENNKREPNIDTLKKIAKVLGITINELMGSTSFNGEIFEIAISIAKKDLNQDNNDIFMILGCYADYDTLINFYNKNLYTLPVDCIKGLLTFINEKSREDFIFVYKFLVTCYTVGSEIEEFCNKLYNKTPGNKNNTNISSNKTIEKDFPVIPEHFTNPDMARVYVMKHQIFAANGFYPERMSDEDILNFANEIINQAELIGYKYKNK